MLHSLFGALDFIFQSVLKDQASEMFPEMWTRNVCKCLSWVDVLSKFGCTVFEPLELSPHCYMYNWIFHKFPWINLLFQLFGFFLHNSSICSPVSGSHWCSQGSRRRRPHSSLSQGPLAFCWWYNRIWAGFSQSEASSWLPCSRMNLDPGLKKKEYFNCMLWNEIYVKSSKIILQLLAKHYTNEP